MLNTPYPWQRNAWQHILTMSGQGRLPHALLFTGNAGMGLLTFANLVAQRLLCLDPQDNGLACGRCQSCQLFSAGSHPDITVIEPEEPGKQIKVMQVRELVEYVSLKSFSRQVKIAIIMPAEAMNRATANALLKTLEEPPEQSMLILLSHQPDRLPITIRSRCQRVDFKSSFDQETLDWINQQYPDSEYSAELLLHLADGGPLSIETMLEENVMQQRQEVIRDIQQILQDKANPVQLAGKWDNIGCERVIYWLMRICQDVTRLGLAGKDAKLTNIDLQQELHGLSRHMNIGNTMRLYQYLQTKYRQATAQTSYNSLSLLEEIIIYWNNPIQLP